MRVSTLILVGLWISAFVGLSGCSSMNRADSLRMLDRRAEYDESENTKILPAPGLKEAGLDGFSSGPVPVRTRPKVASIWIHPHEMASHDYFWGGWMSVVVEPDQWLLSRPGGLPSAPGVSDITGSNLSASPATILGATPKLRVPHQQTAR